MLQTREQWKARTDRECGNTAWNPDAKFWRAFANPDVVAVVSAERPTTGLWQDVTLLMVDGPIVRRRLTF